MKKVFPHIIVFPLLTILMIVSVSINAYAVPIPMFEQFANNIEEGRFTLSEAMNFQGEFHSEYDVIVSGETWKRRGRDPQLAILLSEFNVNGLDITDALIDMHYCPRML